LFFLFFFALVGQVIRVSGEGMPRHEFPSEFGDLFITFKIIFPKGVSAQQADAFRQVLKA
jgi:DnaJ-class molecular chaperone